MERSQLRVELSRRDRDRLAAVSRAEGVSERKFVETLLEKALTAFERKRRDAAKTGEARDERLLSRMRVILAGALESARDWRELQAGLSAYGVRLAPSGGGLMLLENQTGRKLAKASDIGPGYASLVAKFGAPFPEHPHEWIAERALATRRG